MVLMIALHGRFKQKIPRFSMKNSQDFQLPPNSLHIIGRKKRNNMGVSLLFCNFATVMLGKASAKHVTSRTPATIKVGGFINAIL